jgi:MFS family permease
MDKSNKIFTRNYTICFLGTFLIYCSIYFLIPILPLHLEEIGIKRSEIGVIIGAFSATSIVLRLMVGRLIDRYSIKVLMVSGSSIFLVAPLLYLLTASGAGFILVRLFHGMGLAVYVTAAVVTVAGVAPPGRLAHVTGIYVTSVSAAMGIAPILGSYARSAGTFAQGMYFLCFLAGCILILSLFLQESPSPPAQVPRQAFLTVLSDRNILVPSLAFITCSFSLGRVTAFLPLYIQPWGSHQVGLFFFIYSLTLVSIRLLGGGLSDSLGRKAVIVPSLLIIFLSTLAFVFVGSTWSLAANAVFLALGAGLLYPTLNALVVEQAAAENRGTALGIFSASVDGGLFIGPAAMGYVGYHLGLQEMFLVASMAPLLGALFFLRCAPPDASESGVAKTD